MTDHLTGYERRITLRLLGYWEKKRMDRRMPRESDIDAADIADLWEYCFLARVKDLGKPGYHFTYLGKAIEELYDGGLTDKQKKQPHLPYMDEMANGYKQVIEKAEPLVTEGEITTPHGDMFKYRQVLLPLGTGNRVDAVFGGMRFLRIVKYM